MDTKQSIIDLGWTEVKLHEELDLEYGALNQIDKAIDKTNTNKYLPTILVKNHLIALHEMKDITLARIMQLEQMIKVFQS